MAQSINSKRLRTAFADYNHPSNPRAMANCIGIELASDDIDHAVACYTAMWTAYLIAKQAGHPEWLDDGHSGALTSMGIGGPLVDNMLETPNV